MFWYRSNYGCWNDTISRESYKSNEDESQEDNMNIDIGINKATNPFTKR